MKLLDDLDQKATEASTMPLSGFLNFVLASKANENVKLSVTKLKEIYRTFIKEKIKNF